MKTVFFTRKGDGGSSKVGKKLICKDNELFDVLGQLDSLNSWLGFARVEALKNTKTRKLGVPILALQEILFIAQAETASIGFGLPVSQRVTAKHVGFLEGIIRLADQKLPKITKFIVPGGSELAVRLDIARTETRSLERSVVRHQKVAKFSPDFLAFMNRLSSVLFALARLANRELGKKEQHPSYS